MMQYPIVVSKVPPSVPAVCAPTESENDEYQQRTAEVEAEIALVKKTIEDTQEAVNKISLDVRCHNGALSEEVDRLSILIDELQAELAALEAANRGADSFEEDFDSEDEDADDEDLDGRAQSNNTRKALESEDESSISSVKLCKLLFKAIAMKCHPDRTKIPRLRAIFVRANKAMRMYDLAELQEIYNDVMPLDAPYRTRIDWRSRYANAKVRLSIMHERLNEISRSDGFGILQASLNHGVEVARHLYGTMLVRVKDHLNSQIAALEEAIRSQKIIKDINNPSAFSPFGIIGQFEFDEDEDEDEDEDVEDDSDD